jgi:hypothetical protein
MNALKKSRLMREDLPRQRGVVTWYLSAVGMLALTASQIVPMPLGWKKALLVMAMVLVLAAVSAIPVLGMTKKMPAGLFRIGWSFLIGAYLFAFPRILDLISTDWEVPIIMISTALLLISAVLFAISAVPRS